MTLTTGEYYAVDALKFVGWSGPGTAGYNYFDYFADGGVYLGPDSDGIEPLFER